MAGNRKTNGGVGDEGKNKNALVQNTDTCKESFHGQREQPGVKILSVPSRNSRVTCKESSLGQREQLGEKILSDFSHKNCVTCKESTLGQREQLGAKILSSINGIESEGIKSELTFDIFMCMERGLDGRWAIGWSKFIEVGPKVVQPLKSTGQYINSSSPFKTTNPKFVWRPWQSQNVVNLARSQQFISDCVAQVLGSKDQKSTESSLGESESRVLPSVERPVGASLSGVGTMPMSVLGVQVTRKELATRCNLDLVILDSIKADFSGFTDSGVEVTHRLGSRDSGFTGDMGFSSAMAVFEPLTLIEVPPSLCRQPWVAQNRFSSPSVLGNGTEVEFGEREAHAEEQSSTHDDMTQ